MRTVGSLVKKMNSNSLQAVHPGDPVWTAIRKMSDYGLGAVLVMENDQIVGIFSEKDYARKMLLNGRSSLTTSIGEVMNPKVLYVTPEYTLDECLALMTRKKIRHLPVIENKKLLAVLDMENIVEATLEDKLFHIAELTKYVTGTSLIEVSPVLPSNVRELVLCADSRGWTG